MQRTTRRIVTGHDAHGNSVIVSDSAAPEVYTRRPGVDLIELWNTRADPAPITSVEAAEPVSGQRTLGPGAHGSVLRFVDFWPPEPGTQPFMHRTETVDYGIVLEGEIHMLLDDSDTLVRAGDVVIQRGTDHAWQNRSQSVCRMAFILLAGRFDPALGELLRVARPQAKLTP